MFFINLGVIIFSYSPYGLHHFNEILICRAAEMDICIVVQKVMLWNMTILTFPETVYELVHNVFSWSGSRIEIRIGCYIKWIFEIFNWHTPFTWLINSIKCTANNVFKSIRKFVSETWYEFFIRNMVIAIRIIVFY